MLNSVNVVRNRVFLQPPVELAIVVVENHQCSAPPISQRDRPITSLLATSVRCVAPPRLPTVRRRISSRRSEPSLRASGQDEWQ